MYKGMQPNKGPENGGRESPLLGRIVIAALVAVVLSGSLFFSYFLISQIQHSHSPSQSSTTSAPITKGTTSTTTAWAVGDTPLLSAPGTGKPTVTVGQQFPLALLGDTAKVGSVVWYHVQWKAPKTSGEGWAPASALTFTSPGSVPGWASFDVLSPELEQYLTNLGPVTSAVAYDVTRQRYYTYNMNGRFITGSSIKVPVMLTFLNMIEAEGRQPTITRSAC